MRGLINAMQAQIQMALQGQLPTRLGIITGYDPGAYAVKVQFPPDTTETGWIPLGALAVGAGWGIYAAPVLGDQIAVTFQDGDRDAAVAGLRLFDNDSPPVSVQSGEIWMVHKMGQFFKLTNDGKLALNDTKGGSITLNGDGTMSSAGTWTHTGALTVSSDLTVNGSTAVKAIASNSHDIGSTHKHLASGGSGLGGTPQ